MVMVKVLENVGLPEAGLKLQDAPEGRPPVHERVTNWAMPVCRVAVIVFEPELPWATVIPSKSDNEYVEELDIVVVVPFESVSMSISSLYMVKFP